MTGRRKIKVKIYPKSKLRLPILSEIMKEALGRDTKKYPVKRTALKEMKAGIGVKSLTFIGTVTGNSDTYKVAIKFFDVKFSDEKLKGYREVKAHGKVRYFEIPNININRFQWKSEDSNFRFMWEKPLFDNQLLIGNWRRYVRKTPPPSKGGYPFKNPDGIIGYSYPIHNMLRKLATLRLIRQ